VKPCPPHWLPQPLAQFAGGGVGEGVGGVGGVGAGAEVVGAGVGGAGLGCGAPATLKSMHEWNTSGPRVQTPLGVPPAARYSDWLKLSVGFPTLLKSLHEFPVFHSHRPTAF